jgi:hypothetical protein
MGFAWESANVRHFGMSEVWDYPPPRARHRKPPRRLTQAGVARTAIGQAIAVARWARVVVWPTLLDHRRAF